MCNDCIIILIFMSTLALSIYCLMILYLSIWPGVFRPISQSPNLFETIGKNVGTLYILIFISSVIKFIFSGFPMKTHFWHTFYK